MAAETRRRSSGTISFDTNVSFVDDVVKVTTNDLTTKDRLITLNKGGTLGSDTSGIEIESGGSIVATIGYTDSGGWNFGNRNITTTGTVSGSLSLTANSVNDTHIDFGTGTNQVNTDDLPEGSSNLYYTSARANTDFDTRLGTKSTTNLAEGSNLYYTDARADARITNALIDEDNMASNSATKLPSQQSVKAYVDAQILTKDNTDEITEGSTNLYFTNARADARITAADIADLNNVNNASPTDGQVLTWDNSNSYWKPTTPASGGGTDVQRFKINYATNGQLSSITDKTSGISSVSIDSAAGGDITINFTGYSYPPASVTLYGYKYSLNKYEVNPLNKDITLREIPGGGSAGSPTAFGSFSSMKIKAAESDTGANRSFGTTTHAWVQVVMGG